MNVDNKPNAENIEDGALIFHPGAESRLFQSQVTALNARRNEMPPPMMLTHHGRVTCIRRNFVETTSVKLFEVASI